MVETAKRAFFDDLAARWDTFTDGSRVQADLRKELSHARLAAGERVVDLGCGTGNLTAVLLEVLGSHAQIAAVDFSGAMIAKAKSKFSSPCVQWYVADAAALPLADGSFDRVICFSAWPHFAEPGAILDEIRRVLRPGGVLSILHLNGREAINNIHLSSDDVIRRDLLPAAIDLATLVRSAGFDIEECCDQPDRYCVQGHKRRSHS